MICRKKIQIILIYTSEKIVNKNKKKNILPATFFFIFIFHFFYSIWLLIFDTLHIPTISEILGK